MKDYMSMAGAVGWAPTMIHSHVIFNKIFTRYLETWLSDRVDFSTLFYSFLPFSRCNFGRFEYRCQSHSYRHWYWKCLRGGGAHHRGSRDLCSDKNVYGSVHRSRNTMNNCEIVLKFSVCAEKYTESKLGYLRKSACLTRVAINYPPPPPFSLSKTLRRLWKVILLVNMTRQAADVVD